MSSTLIATTQRASYNAMRHQGILVTDSYAQLRAMLEKTLSPRHAMLFAEPAHDSAGASTDWYTAAQGAPVPLDRLSPEEKAKAGAAISSLASDVSQLASELMQSSEAPKNIRGNILALALRYPDAGHLYMVGDQPVITCWGFDPGTLGAQPEDLVRLGSAMAAPPPLPGPAAAASAAPSGFGWLRALLFFLLGLLLLLGLLFLACLLFGPAGCVAPNSLPADCTVLRQPFAGCVPAPASPPPSSNSTNSTRVDSGLVSSLTAEREKELSLRRQLEDLRRELQKRAAECPRVSPKTEPPKLAEGPKLQEPPAEKPPVPEPAPEPPAKEPELPAEVEQPSPEEFLPTTPDEPEKPVAPRAEPKQEKKPQEKPKPEPKPQKQARGEEMRIPDDARKNNDVSFLEGCWNSETGLRSDRTREPIGVQYCFDANGHGTRTITKPQSGDRCVGSVRAKFDSSGRLRIDSDGAPCGKGGGFVPEQVDCSSAGGKADCSGAVRGDPQRKWKARFRRG